VASWGPIALAQRDRLYRIAGAVRSVTAAAGSLAASKRGGAAAALREVLGGLAAAAATSHLAGTSERLFAAAEQAQASLSLRSLQANVVDLEAAMDHAHAVAGSDRANRDLAAPYLQTQGDAQRLASRAAAGGEVSAEELERVQLSAQETALRARLHGLQIQLDQLQRAGDEALAGLTGHIAQFGSSRFRHLHDATQFMHAAAGEITLELAAALRTTRPVADDPSNPTALPPDLLARRAALSRAQARFARLGGDRGLADFLAQSARLVRNQQIRAAIVQAGLMIGITILTSGAGGWVAEGLGEGYLAAQGAETVSQLSLGARAAIQVGAAATEITGNAIGQQLTTGGSLGSALADNAVFTLGTSGTLGAVARDLHAAAAFEKLLAHELAAIDTAEARAAAALTRFARAGRVAAWTAGQAGSITSHTVMGMALGSLVARLHAAPHAGPAQLDEWLIQGASVALGKLTHVAIGERLPSYARLAQRKDAAHAQRLLADAQQLHALAAAIAHHPGADAALELLRRRKQLLETELATVDELAQQPDAEAHAAPHDGPSPQELSAMRADLQTQLAEVHAQGMLDLRWHLLGLHELAPGLWSGTPDQLAAAVREARTAGHRVELAAGPSDGVRRLIVDGKPIELHERVPAAPARQHDASQRPEAPTVPGRGQDSPGHDRASSGHGRERSPADPTAKPTTPAGATPAQQALAARLAPDVTAVGDRRYTAPAARLVELHATWKQANGSNASKIHYDAQVNASYFE
ncbi:MAG TPA: hypothetical protein VK607_16335, partial [Kofleriaceae bacterium]|nr:hypothetical protein [Kofleriaceae bacterium]